MRAALERWNWRKCCGSIVELLALGSLEFNLLGTFEEYRESYSAGKVLDSGSQGSQFALAGLSF